MEIFEGDSGSRVSRIEVINTGRRVALPRMRSCGLSRKLCGERPGIGHGTGPCSSISSSANGRMQRSVSWGIASFRPAPEIMLRMPKQQKRLKNFPTAVAEISAGPAKGRTIEIWYQDEARIGQKKQDHAPLGGAGIKTIRPSRPAHTLGIHIRRDLPQAWQSRRSRHAVV